MKKMKYESHNNHLCIQLFTFFASKAAEPSLHIRFKKLVVRHNGLLASLRRVRGK